MNVNTNITSTVQAESHPVAETCNNIDSRHNLLQCAINGKGCHALLDSGATVSVISEHMYSNVLRCSKVYCMLDSIVKHVSGVGGTVIPVKGKVVLPVKVCDLQLWREFLVLPGKADPQLILGSNFLKEQNVQWDFNSGMVSIQNGLVTCSLQAQSQTNTRVCFVKTMSDIVVPAQSEMVIPVKVSHRGGELNKCSAYGAGVVEPTLSLQKKYCLAGARCAVEPSADKCCYRVLNPMSQDAHLPGNSVVATYSPTEGDTTLVHMSELPDTLIPSPHPSNPPPEPTAGLNPNAKEFRPRRADGQECSGR